MGDRQRIHRHHQLGHVQRRRLGGDRLAELQGQLAVERPAIPHHRQQHQPRAAVPALFDRHRLLHLGQIAQRLVDLAGADSDALDVQHPVGAAVDPRLPVPVELDQVAVGPDALVGGEVGVVEAAAVLVAEQAERPRGERIAADELPDPRIRRRRLRRQRLHVEAEAAGLEHPAPDRQLGVAEGEAADDVGAAGDRLQLHRADLLGDPVELPVAQDRTGGEDRSQGGRRRLALGRVAAVLAELQVRRAGAEDRGLLGGDDLPQRPRPGKRPVVEDDLGAAGQRRELPVPHHPGGARLEEERVARAEVAVQAVLLQVLDQGAASAMDDALWRPGGARGEEDEERVVEGKALPTIGQGPRGWVGGELGEAVDGKLDGVRGRRAVQRHQRLQAGEGGGDLGDVVAAQVRQQQLRRELLEAAEDGGGAHVRGGAGEGCAEGCGGKRADRRLGGVGGDRGDAVSGTDAEPTQVRRHRPHLRAQLAAGDLLARPVAVATHQRDLLVLLGRTCRQQVLGVAQAQIWEEARELDPVVAADRFELSLPQRIGPLDEEPPEVAEALDGKVLEGLRIDEPLPDARFAEPDEASESGFFGVYGRNHGATHIGFFDLGLIFVKGHR